jgi:hypothetical protein
MTLPATVTRNNPGKREKEAAGGELWDFLDKTVCRYLKQLLSR